VRVWLTFFSRIICVWLAQAVTIALDGKHKDREAVSLLLAALYPDTIKPEQMAMGVTKLLISAEDLALDVPKVSCTNWLTVIIAPTYNFFSSAPRCSILAEDTLCVFAVCDRRPTCSASSWGD
jgi:hypothetical protein